MTSEQRTSGDDGGVATTAGRVAALLLAGGDGCWATTPEVSTANTIEQRKYGNHLGKKGEHTRRQTDLDSTGLVICKDVIAVSSLAS